MADFDNISEVTEVCLDIREYLWNNRSDLTLQPATMATFGAIYSLFIALGVLGNLLVVISVHQYPQLQSVRNIFIVSLSVSDIVVCLVSGSVTPITAITKIWIFGEHLCHLVPLIQGTSLCFSTLTLMVISIDRFILIIFPTRKPIQKSQAMKLVLLNVSVAASVTMPMVLKQTIVTWGNFCGQFCTEDWGDDYYARSFYGTVLFILQFIIPLVVITFCYFMISFKLGKGMLVRNSKEEAALMTDQKKAALRRRMRTNRMLIGMVGVFFCCWLPTVTFNFLRDYGWLPSFVMSQDYLFGLITHCISISSTVWNPCLYALLNEQFRTAFSSLLQRLKGSEDREKKNHCNRLLSTDAGSTRRGTVSEKLSKSNGSGIPL